MRTKKAGTVGTVSTVGTGTYRTYLSLHIWRIYLSGKHFLTVRAGDALHPAVLRLPQVNVADVRAARKKEDLKLVQNNTQLHATQDSQLFHLFRSAMRL